MLSRSIKDFACRLQTMKGFLVNRKAGWDTHGLPVEIAAEKKLGFEELPPPLILSNRTSRSHLTARLPTIFLARLTTIK